MPINSRNILNDIKTRGIQLGFDKKHMGMKADKAKKSPRVGAASNKSVIVGPFRCPLKGATTEGRLL